MIHDLFHLILMGVLVYKWGLGDDVNTTLNLKYVLFLLCHSLYTSHQETLKWRLDLLIFSIQMCSRMSFVNAIASANSVESDLGYLTL